MGGRTKVETRIRILEGGHSLQVSGTAKAAAKFDKHEMKPEVQEYKPAADNTLKRKIKDEEGAGEATEAEPVKKKKEKNKENEEANAGDNSMATEATPVKAEVNGANGHEEASPILNGGGDTESTKKKKKKKKNKEAV